MSLMYLRLYPTQTLLGYLFDLDTSNVSCEVQGRMLEVLSEVLPVPAREEPLDLALAVGGDRSSGRSAGSKSKRRIATLEELLEKHPEFEEIFVLMAPSKSCPSPRTKPAAKTSTAANAKDTLPRCRW